MFNVFELSPNLTVIDTGEELNISPSAQEKVSSIWSREKENRGDDLFEGRIFNVTEITRETLTGFYIDYSVFLAQYCESGLFEDLAVRSLTVSGFVTCEQGVIVGLRNENLTQDAGLWELVASGGVDETVRLDDGTVDIHEQFLNELCEEINLPVESVSELSSLVLLEDSETHVCDIVLEARLSVGADILYPLFNECGCEEYVEIDIIPEPSIKSFVQLMNSSITPATLEILAHKGYVKLLGSPA